MSNLKKQAALIDRMNPIAMQTLIGTKLDQLMSALNLLAGGTGVMAPQHTMSNSTVSLALTAFTYYINGVPARKAAGNTALTATTHDVAATKWASYRVSIQSGGTVTITKSTDQDTEALAVANLPALPANEANVGYFLVRGGDAAIFDATTNNLATGAVTGMIVKFLPATAAVPDPVTQLV